MALPPDPPAEALPSSPADEAAPETRRGVAAGVGAVALGASLRPASAAARDPIRIGSPLDMQIVRPLTLIYRQGQRDFVTYRNALGGVAGHPLELHEGDHRNDAALGLELYAEMRARGVVAVDPLSTLVSEALLEPTARDGVNLITFYSGRGEAADGRRYPHAFPLSPTYWSQATALIRYVSDREGGQLAGRTVAVLAPDVPNGLGRVSLPCFEMLAARLGFRLAPMLYTWDGPAALAPALAAAAPDWVLVWDGSPAKIAAIQMALGSGIAADRITALAWLSEADVRQLGEAARGIIRFEGVASGRDPRLLQGILKHVVVPGRGAGPSDNVGTTFYNMGVASMAILSEGARIALSRDGAPLTGPRLRAGLQKLRGFTGSGLMAPLTVTPADHQGGGAGRIALWSGAAWVPATPWFSADQPLVWELIAGTTRPPDRATP